jgi:hypothetical protein
VEASVGSFAGSIGGKKVRFRKRTLYSTAVAVLYDEELKTVCHLETGQHYQHGSLVNS